jgi:hypothetical protein
MRTTFLVLFLLHSLAVVGCGDTFNTTVESAVDPSSGGAGSASTSSASSNSATAGTGTAECVAGEKTCGATCVAIDSPATGCGAASCDPCPTPHATAVCANQSCAVGVCVGVWKDCDGDQVNGCESDSMSDPYNCGGCGHKCLYAGATIGTCSAGECKIGPCVLGRSDCDGKQANGCEIDNTSDPDNCSSCMLECGDGLGCANGNCHACGGDFNPPTSGGSEFLMSAAGQWVAMRHVPQFTETISSICINAQPTSTNKQVDLYVMTDKNGFPDVKISLDGVPGPLPFGYSCFDTTPNGVPVTLGGDPIHVTSGVPYWIVTNARGITGDSHGQHADLILRSDVENPWAWEQIQSEHGTIEVVATCN